MSDFEQTWQLSRQRFVDAVKDLNAEQLNYHIYPDALSIGEMALHVAGVEISFATQIRGLDIEQASGLTRDIPIPFDILKRVKSAATQGVTNDLPLPFGPEEIAPDLIAKSLEASRRMVAPIMANPTEEHLKRQIASALGPIITGAGALARLAFHPAYHHGQAYLIRTAPGFPQ